MITHHALGLHRRHGLLVRLLSYGVALNGVLIIASVLRDQVGGNFLRIEISELGEIIFSLPLFLGLTLVYLSVLLRRRKLTAWLVTILVYGFVLGINIVRLASVHHPLTAGYPLARILINIALPATIVAILALLDDHFTVKSDIRGFSVSLQFVVAVMAIALIYGVTGFMLLDVHDFHHQITLGEAFHRTIDQFGLTTNSSLVPYTRRAHIFLNSLSFISLVAVGYAFLSFFQPLRARFSDQSEHRHVSEKLLAQYNGNSEDFFKLWPHDKYYFFDEADTAGLAYTVRHGIALVVGDPMGDAKKFARLLREFDELCWSNDWRVAYVHTTPDYAGLYRAAGFSLQKIGEEAVLDLQHFKEHTENNKYFRQIKNRFDKQGYTAELLKPPHNQALLNRLSTISKEWLDRPGRAERGFMMGSYTNQYMQLCNIMVLRDQAGTIQAFINQIPSYDPHEANFDLLRHTHEALGNSNDRLLLAFIHALHAEGFARLNLGLCPLSGLDDKTEERTVITNALRFVYANGDRFYSFSGLRRFKEKYEPVWQPRYIAYRGGLSSFTKALNALNRAMRVRKPRHLKP